MHTGLGDGTACALINKLSTEHFGTKKSIGHFFETTNHKSD